MHARDLDLARTEYVSGLKITAPGFCQDKEYDALVALVHNHCKNGAVKAYRGSDTVQQMRDKATAFYDCAIFRSQREDRCFKGGDPKHKQKIAEMKNGYVNCIEMIGE